MFLGQLRTPVTDGHSRTPVPTWAFGGDKGDKARGKKDSKESSRKKVFLIYIAKGNKV